LQIVAKVASANCKFDNTPPLGFARALPYSGSIIYLRRATYSPTVTATSGGETAGALFNYKMSQNP
jgi:hypothetical protein